MIEITVKPLTAPQMATITAGEYVLHPGPLPPTLWVMRALEWLLENPAPSSNYYYAKTGLSA